MNREVSNLEPKALWHHFAQLNAIPRATGKEAAAAKYVMEVAAQHNLEATRDKAGNVLVLKPAAAGMENCAAIALQAHLDMVHQKNTDFDFDNQGIEMYAEGDWVKARGTTLGADNGIGVAAMLAILASGATPHPPLEALFTVGEEKGMTGALGLGENVLTAAAMINLDTEEEGTLTIGCAGRVAIQAKGKYDQEQPPVQGQAFALSISGLAGGHSGLDIHLGHGNAIKLICKLLTAVSARCCLRVSTISGGNLLNAIPREAVAQVVVEDAAAFLKSVNLQTKNLQSVFASTDPRLQVHIQPALMPAHVMNLQDQQRILHVINWCPDGVYTMCSDMPGLVQTSNNVAMLVLENGEYRMQCLTRSSADVEKARLAKAIKRAFKAAGAEVELQGSCSGWPPAPESSIVLQLAETYNQLFGTQPSITAMHAGLECGIISGKYPGMEIVSIGPTILGPHSPEERVKVSSVQRFWQLLCEALAGMPAKEHINPNLPCAVEASYQI